MNKTKSWFIEKINKVGELLARWTKEKTENTQITKIKNDIRDITTDFTKIKKDYKRVLWTVVHQQTG